MENKPSLGDLVAYWPFNEGSGLTAYDSTGNGNTRTLQNGVALRPKKA